MPKVSHPEISGRRKSIFETLRRGQGEKSKTRVIFAPLYKINFPKLQMQDLHQFQESFDAFLRKNQFHTPPKELYEPANYILSLGGKRLRPALLLAGHYLFDDNYEASLPAAFAVEVFHNFSLVHDDIMDAAPLRRGQPTVHTKFGLNAGVLSGDAMLVLAYDFLLKTESPALLELVRRFNQMAIQVCEGQQMDLNFETQQRVTIEEYLQMVEMKTAVLVACALEIGALIGGASSTDARLLYEFGRNLGIAFQLQDDILDAFGDPEKFGKRTGGDIAQNKKTYLFLKALEVAPAEMAKRLSVLFSLQTQQEEQKIEEVLELFNQLNIKELTEKKKDEYWQESLLALSKISAPPNRTALLHGFAAALMNREF